ncbi:MAG: holo-ACP synthase [Fibrobacter sp.]|mgnify:CR=1 FL=1|nr:holo-ACP synthase [Fibrobacter sp.]
MIGVGIDIVDIKRIARLIEKYGDGFTKKVFTDNEIQHCSKSYSASSHFAGRWAVKEAFYKALPDSCQPFSSWKSIEILPGEGTRKPKIVVCTDELQNALKKSEISKIHVSISHEQEFCTAIVILE